MAESYICPSCKTRGMHIFHQAESVPTNSCILLGSREEALSYPRGSIQLAFCPACGFISNMAFDSKLTEYSGRYEETQGFSETFNSFHRDLAQRLIERHHLHHKDILEIGCGKGEFLLLLAELGNNRGVGFDPGYREERVAGEAARRVRFIKDFYSEKYRDYKADFLCCKMTLEHIHPTADFISTIRQAIGDRPDTIVFFQIPEVTRILRDCAFEDIYYEHCSYFSPGSLARLFRSNGFHVVSLETEYADQYLTIEARPAQGAPTSPLPQEDDLPLLARYVAEFPAKRDQKLSEWRRRVEETTARGQKIVLWGSGSKGVSFLTTLGIGDKIEYVVDINPYRQGYYMPATGQRIVAPAFLREYRPDLVIIMNAIYQTEITRDLHGMGLYPEVLAL
jgi:SAM-dependent methyltransferase